MSEYDQEIRKLKEALAKANQKIAKAQEECNSEIDEFEDYKKKLGDDHYLMEDYDIQLGSVEFAQIILNRLGFSPEKNDPDDHEQHNQRLSEVERGQ